MSMKEYAAKKEYIVTLFKHEDLDQFYTEMENKGGNEYVPERAVALIERRDTSRNTHYWLTEWESLELKKDSRVRNVCLHPRYLGISAGLTVLREQTSSNWNKSSSTGNTMLNWGLLRCYEGDNRSGWGSNGTNNQTGTIKLPATGKNVDVVVVDGDGIVFGHPEYTVNADGTGSYRSNQYNWFQHDPAVKGSAAGNYSYSISDHATHVSGTIAGNTQGWAREANIYNIYYYAGAIGNNNFPYVMDYVREFHRTKSINPATGRKNPTITNNSWGMSIFPSEWAFGDITAVTYRGTRYTPSGAVTFLGVSGVCTSNARLAQLNGFENHGNRITTNGPYTPPGGSILSIPETWLQQGQQAYITLVGATGPDPEYQVFVQGPADINILNNTAIDVVSGAMSLTSGIEIYEGANPVPIATFSDGPYSTTNGGTVEALIEEFNISLPNFEQYIIKFTSAIVLEDASNPTYATSMSVTVITETTPATASVTTITNSLLGAAALTSATTPSLGNNDDGYWNLTLPFNITYLGATYTTIYVGTNFYLTFTDGSTIYSGISVSSPNLPKIMLCCGDRSVQRIYYGVEGAETATYTVTNSGASAYTINSSSNPTLTLQRGGTYTFNVSATGHPFWIKTAQVTGTGSAYSTGVTNNGTDSGTITFTVPGNAPSTLYYICQVHGSMVGTINVVAGTRTYRVRMEGSTGTTGTLGSPTMVCEYVFYEATPDQIDLQIGSNAAKSSGTGFSTEQLNTWGFISGQRIPKRVAALDSDIEDAIQEGIMYVGAAGNGRWKHCLPGDTDWDNTFEMATRYPGSVAEPYYYMRGTSPTANDVFDPQRPVGDQGYNIPNICVGSIDVTSGDYKASYSDCGPGVDIWAPGTNIISSLTSGVSDSRSSGTTYYLGKFSGTSMASPQVCGVLACALENNPFWNQTQAKEYILGVAKTGQITATTGGPADVTDLQGAPNKYLYYKRERLDTGTMVPKQAVGARPTTGAAWPRSRIRRFR